MEQGRVVRVFTDRVVSPSYVVDIAAATRHLVDSGAAPGLYHCVNSGHATWHDVALETARLLGVAPRLEPMTMDQARAEGAAAAVLRAGEPQAGRRRFPHARLAGRAGAMDRDPRQAGSIE